MSQKELKRPLETAFGRIEARVDGADQRLDRAEGRIDGAAEEMRRHFDATAERMEKKFDLLAETLSHLDQKIDRLDLNMNQGFAETQAMIKSTY